jgi:predicted RNA-binding Zn-ribbon protein involved in translation (DUF1610 family)
VVNGSDSVSPSLPQTRLARLREAAARAHRAARAFLIFPIVIGAVQFAFALIDGATLGEVPTLIVTFAIAVSGFYLTLCIASLIAELASGTNAKSGALATEVICPSCGHRQHIANLRCVKCREPIGIPEGSTHSYLYCLLALAIFQGLWMVRGGKYFFGVG